MKISEENYLSDTNAFAHLATLEVPRFGDYPPSPDAPWMPLC
jgi:hypothetical protein